MVVVAPVASVGGIRAAVAVADRIGAEPDRGVDGNAEVGLRAARRLDQQEVARGADRGDHVEVERDLLAPAGIGPRIAVTAGLVDLAEAPAATRARRQA